MRYTFFNKVLLLVSVLLIQACSQGKYIYWRAPEALPQQQVNGYLAYQYIEMNQVPGTELAEYCRQLQSQQTVGYQLYILQLSCAQRWLALPLSVSQQEQAIAFYNRALEPLVRAALSGIDTRHLNVSLQLIADEDEQGLAFEHFYLAPDLQAYDSFITPIADNGIGIRAIGQRENTNVGQDKYYPPEGIFRPLSVVPLALDFSNPVLPVLTLRAVFTDTLSYWQVGPLSYPLNTDPASAYLCLVEVAVADQLEQTGLFNADKVEDKLGIYAIEPPTADKIPLLMIHGLNSSPLIWRRLTWAIFSDAELSRKYQIWHAFYPSGPPPFFNAMRLRQLTDVLRQRTSTDADSVALNNMVVIGHSMGGLIAKTFVQNTDRVLWDTTFFKPPEMLKVDADTGKTLQDILIFSAQPYVSAAVFIDTPHRGAATADSWLARLASGLITLPSAMKNVFSKLWLGLTAKDIKPPMRRYMRGYGPNSVDVLSPQHPLVQQLATLPFTVPVYSVIGNNNSARCKDAVQCPDLNDSVVPYSSAHLDKAVAEIIVPSAHNSYQSEGAISFILAMLRKLPVNTP